MEKKEYNSTEEMFEYFKKGSCPRNADKGPVLEDTHEEMKNEKEFVNYKKK